MLNVMTSAWLLHIKKNQTNYSQSCFIYYIVAIRNISGIDCLQRVNLRSGNLISRELKPLVCGMNDKIKMKRINANEYACNYEVMQL